MDQAEQLRIIKANNQIRPTARVITVTSGKGGVGKSNMSINLAIQFRKMGKRVIILDADFGLANIEIMFGAIPKHNLCDLVYEGKSISDIITWGPMEVGFISGGSGIAGMSNLGKDALTCIIQNLAELDALTDIIIVDTGAGISDSVLEFLVASGEGAVFVYENTTLPSLNLYPFPTRWFNFLRFRFQGLQIIPTRVILLIGYSFRGLRSVFYAGDQIVVYVLVPAVKMPLVDYLAAGAKTDQIGGRFTPGFVVVKEGVNHRMPGEKRDGFGQVDDRVQNRGVDAQSFGVFQ